MPHELHRFGLPFLCAGVLIAGAHAYGSTWNCAPADGVAAWGLQKAAATVEVGAAEKHSFVLAQAQPAMNAIRQAESQLQQASNDLAALRARFPNAPEVSKAMEQLQALTEQIMQLQTEAQTLIDRANANPALAAASRERLTQLEVQARTIADRGSGIVNRAVAELNATQTVTSDGPLHPGERPAVRHSVAHPKTLEPQQEGDKGNATGQPQEVREAIQPATTSAPDTDAEGAWFAKLQKGLLQYSVPGTMLWKVPSTVTVQINGEKSATTASLDNQTGQAPVTVARRMKVLVSAPDNPDEFVIAPESDTQLEEFVPADGPTTWHFSVTPRYSGNAQKLVVQAWVIYDANTSRELPVYRTVVNVHIPSFWECVKRLVEGDPDYWLKYGMPGGAGFVFISGIVVGIWKWVKKRKEAQRPAHV